MVTLDRRHEIAEGVTVEFIDEILAAGTSPAVAEHLAQELWMDLQIEIALGA